MRHVVDMILGLTCWLENLIRVFDCAPTKHKSAPSILVVAVLGLVLVALLAPAALTRETGEHNVI